MDRRTAAAFGLLSGITTIVAVGAILSFGPNSSLPETPDFGMTGDALSVWTLLLAPTLLVLVGSLSAFGLKWHLRAWPQSEAPGSDAQRALNRYTSGLRLFLIGCGGLITFVQALAVVRTAGVDLPSEFDIRAFYFIFGLLLASVGNITPRIPPVPDKWYSGPAVAKFYRFTGWIFTIGGILFCLSAVLAPIERVRPVTQLVIYAILGLPLLYIFLQAMVGSRQQQR
jgi:hypothetical protein